jgi:hypothetical protein
MPQWRPVYLDGSTAIYLRKSYANRIPDLDYAALPGKWGIPKDILDQAVPILQAPAEPAWVYFWKGFFLPSVYPKWFQSMGVFSTFAGHPETAEAMDLEAIRETRGRFIEFYYNLRGLFAAANQRDDEYLCGRHIQEMKSGGVLGQVVGNVSTH